MSKIHDELYKDPEYCGIKWQVRRDNPYCSGCGYWLYIEDRTVDHIVPLSARSSLAKEVSNLQVLCEPCHNNKTRRSDNHFNDTMKIAFERSKKLRVPA